MAEQAKRHGEIPFLYTFNSTYETRDKNPTRSKGESRGASSGCLVGAAHFYSMAGFVVTTGNTDLFLHGLFRVGGAEIKRLHEFIDHVAACNKLSSLYSCSRNTASLSSVDHIANMLKLKRGRVCRFARPQNGFTIRSSVCSSLLTSKNIVLVVSLHEQTNTGSKRSR